MTMTKKNMQKGITMNKALGKENNTQEGYLITQKIMSSEETKNYGRITTEAGTGGTQMFRSSMQKGFQSPTKVFAYFGGRILEPNNGD